MSNSRDGMKIPTKRFAFALVAVFVFVAQNVRAQDDSNLSLNLSTDLNSDYMWRGLNLYDGMSVQPSADANYDLGAMGNIGVNVWAHLSAEGGNSAAEKFTEIDYTAHWDIAFNDFSLSLGHLWYTYPRSSDNIEDSKEVYFSIGHNCELNPYISVFHDYDEYDNQYYEFGLSHTFETNSLGQGFNTTPYAAIGYATNADKVYNDDSGFTHVAIGTSFDFQTGDLTVSPNINYNFEIDDNTDNEFWIGISLGYPLM